MAGPFMPVWGLRCLWIAAEGSGKKRPENLKSRKNQHRQECPARVPVLHQRREPLHYALQHMGLRFQRFGSRGTLFGTSGG